MTKVEIKELLHASMLVDAESGPAEGFEAVCACDMMSDLLNVMNGAEQNGEKVILLTQLTNPQVIRTAEMVDIQLVVFLRNKKPGAETVELAQNFGISLMSTPYSMYKSCGHLCGANMKDVEDGKERS
ncbi:MAG: hypothetical protein ABIH66_07175 [bacterium]